MMSMLFCQFGGGCITAVESGQHKIIELSSDEIVIIATVYGEVGICSEAAWQGVANVIMNRVGTGYWKKWTTPREIVENTGFDACKRKTPSYSMANEYLINRDYSNEKIERMIELIIPIIREEVEDITDNSVYFYSPNAQKAGHEKYPELYSEEPEFLKEDIEEVKISGAESDDLKFYKYR